MNKLPYLRRIVVLLPAVTPCRITLGLLLAVAYGPWLVSAQDFFHGGVSAETAAHSGIYTASSSDVFDAITLNPAGLSALAAPTAETDMLAGLVHGQFLNAANEESSNGSLLRLHPELGLFGAVGLPLGRSRWSVGFGITPDFFSSVNWHYADSPGTGGADYGNQEERSAIEVFRGAGGLALALTPKLALGTTVGLVYNQNILIAPFIFQSNPDLKGLKTLLDLHTRGLGWGGSFGVIDRSIPRLALSAAYSSPFTINSHGNASGNMGEQFDVLGIPFQPDFTYRARVRVKLPQSVIAGGRWQLTPSVGVSLQADWANFRSAFDKLPVHLTDGSNADIDNFLHSSSIQDEIPLKWSDQFTGRLAVDYKLGEHYQLAGGLLCRSNLVPKATLTPLTGAIMRDSVSTGIAYERHRLLFGAAYALNWNQAERVETSALLAGEYDNSRLTIGAQAVTMSASFRLK